MPVTTTLSIITATALPQCFPLSTRLIGHNNASIEFDETVYLIIVQESFSEFNWAWIGFTIYTYTSGPSILWHENVNSLAIHNCIIITTKLQVTNAHNIVIDSTEFRGTFGGNSFCLRITVIAESQRTSFTFSNSKFSTCKFKNYGALVTFNIMQDDSSLTIVNCTFMEVIGFSISENKDTRFISVNTQKDITAVLTINESSFIGNSKKSF